MVCLSVLFLLTCSLGAAWSQQCRSGLFPPFSSQPVRSYNQWKLDATTLDYLPGGISSYYSLVERFVDSVIPDFPYELVLSTIQGGLKLNEISNVYITCISLFALGLLLAVCFPIIGCCVCCVRCCGFCGGDRKWNYTRNIKYRPWKYWTCCFLLSMALIILIVLLITGLVLALIANANAWSATRDAPGTVINTMEDVKTYLETTQRDINYVVLDQYDATASCIVDGVDTAPVNLFEDVSTSLNFTAIQVAASGAAAKVNRARVLVNQIARSLEKLDDLQNEMNETLIDLDLAIVICDTKCNALSSNYAMRFSNYLVTAPDLTGPLYSVNNTLYVYDVDGATREANKALNNTLSNVLLQVDNFTSDVTTLLNETVKQQLNTSFGAFNAGLSEAISGVNSAIVAVESIFSFNIGSQQETVLNFINDFRLALGIVLCFFVFFIIFLACCGLCNGWIGLIRSGIYPPMRDRFAHCGGQCLLLSSCGVCVLWFLLMFSSAVAFLVGVAMYVPCSELSSPEYTAISKTIDNSNFLSVLLPGGSSQTLEVFGNEEVSISNSLVECSKNESLYQAVNLDAILSLLGYNLSAVSQDITQMMNEQERDIHQQIDGISLTSSSIIDSDSVGKLMELQALGFATVNVSALATSVLSAIGSLEIEDLFMDLESMKASCAPKPSCEAAYNPIINQVNIIRKLSQDIETILNNLTSLHVNAVALETETNVAVDMLLITAMNLNTTLSSSTQLKTASKDYVSALFEVGEDYIDYLQTRLQYDIARCYPPWAAYQTLDVVLCDGVVASYNAFWFSIGWCLLFLVPLFVVAIWLSWFFVAFQDEIVRDDDNERVVIMTNTLGREGYRGQHEMTDFGRVSTYYHVKRSNADESDFDVLDEDGAVNRDRATENAEVYHDRWTQATVYSNKFPLRQSDRSKTVQPPEYFSLSSPGWNRSDTWTETTGLTENEFESLN